MSEKALKMEFVKKNRVLLFCFAVAFVTITFVSRTSFLVPVNACYDINQFFTMGRGTLHGLKPYAEIYDQKGPAFVYLWALIAAVSETTFLGAYLIEIFCFGLTLYFYTKLLCMEKEVGFFVPLFAFFYSTSSAVAMGATLEAFMLPLIVGSVLLLPKRDEVRCGNTKAFAIGLCAGMVFWSKYTLCAPFVGMGIYILLHHKRNKTMHLFLKDAAMFFAGLIAFSIPIVSACFLQGYGPDMMEVYFVHNLTMYGTGDTLLEMMVQVMIRDVISDPLFFICTVFWLFKLKDKEYRKTREFLPFLFMFVGMVATMKVWSYYRLPFVLLGMYTLKDITLKIKGRYFAYGAVVMAFCIAYLLTYGDNAMAFRSEQINAPQLRFAKIINSVPDSTLLEYKMQDSGFYFYAHKDPINRHFCMNNVNYPYQHENQQEVIDNGLATFVVTENREIDSELYELVDQISWEHENRDIAYRLYERR